ncbi:hypothetical protein ACN4GD_32760, partial [Klebsiella pneumoniae subsp. pneumoniae]
QAVQTASKNRISAGEPIPSFLLQGYVATEHVQRPIDPPEPAQAHPQDKYPQVALDIATATS